MKFTHKVTALYGLRLREAPSTSGNIVTTLPFNSHVAVSEQVGNWSKVLAPQNGWMFSSYLQKLPEFSENFKIEAWPCVSQVVTQWFGANPQWYMPYGFPGHEGIDLRAPMHSPFYAVAPGTVQKASNLTSGGNASAYGYHVVVGHSEGYSTLYAHMTPEKVVKVGDSVGVGDVLGFSGNTGRSTGPHLHFTLRQIGYQMPKWPRTYKDPWPYLKAFLDGGN